MSKVAEILLVEDNPNDLELALHAFKKHHFTNEIHVARDGQEALDFIFGNNETTGRPRADSLHLILLDLKLPKIDGHEVLRRVKENPATRRIPVVILTTSREEPDVMRSYDLGVNSYIVKPVDFQKFAASIQTLGMYWLLMNEQPRRTQPHDVQE